MNRYVPAILAFGLMGFGALAETSQPLPTPFPKVRYQQMSAKSPFAVATADAAATAAPTPGFAAQLYVDGMAHVGNIDYVAIKNRNPDEGKPAVVLVEVGKTTEDGLKVERVKWSDEMGKSTVDVSKNGEKATLAFDEDSIKNGPPGQAPVPGQAGVRLPALPGQGRPVGFPVQNGQFNRNRMFPQQQMGGAPGQPNTSAPGIDVRRRVHVIQSGQ